MPDRLRDSVTSEVLADSQARESSIGQDVTASHAAQAELRQRERQLSAFIEQATAGFAQVDKDGVFTLVNNRYCEIVGRTREEQVGNLVGLIDGYTLSNGFHVNVNVLNRDTLTDAMENPDKYPQLTIRVSGYAVNFTRLTREQQLDVLSRTFHGAV